MLLWVKLSSWVARPPRAASISSRDGRRRSSSPAAGDARVADVDDAVVRSGPAAVRIAAETVRADAVDEQDAGVGQHARGRGSGSGRRSIGAALTTAATPASTSAWAVARSRSRWSMTAMSPGRSRRQQAAGAAVDPGGAGEPGQGGGEAVVGRASFMTAHGVTADRPDRGPRAGGASRDGGVEPVSRGRRGRPSSSSRAWASAVSESSSPASIRDSSRTRSLVVERRSAPRW